MNTTLSVQRCMTVLAVLRFLPATQYVSHQAIVMCVLTASALLKYHDSLWIMFWFQISAHALVGWPAVLRTRKLGNKAVGVRIFALCP